MIGSQMKAWLRNDDGATLVEYSLLVGLVSIAIILAVLAISASMGTVWSTLSSIVAQAAG